MRQRDLLRYAIRAKVVYIPNGVEQVYLGSNAIYALFVDEDRVDEAIDSIRLIPDENHQCIYHCPECHSDEVEELPLEEGFGTGPFSFCFTFGIVGMTRMIVMRIRGSRFECLSCGLKYRKKP